MNSTFFSNICSKIWTNTFTFYLVNMPCVTRITNNRFSGTLVLSRFSLSTDGKLFKEPNSSNRTVFHKPSITMDAANNNLFRLSDYDCIGFDLDNTVCEYKIRPMVEMEYDMLSRFMVEKKGYSYKTLYQPLSESDIDFLQKGLILDFERGNILQVGENGVILSASHGTSHMTSEQIEEEYGKERSWNIATDFSQDMLSAWNGPVTEKLRTLLDYFDMPASLLFARAVDSVDIQMGSKKCEIYTVGKDVLAALIHLYNRDHFSSEASDYFKALKSCPQAYIKKCPLVVIDWIKNIKSSKPTFLITGSNVDYASFTASYSLGENWTSLFDVVVCYARKPGFFTEQRPFLKLKGFQEDGKLSSDQLDFGNTYSQGNWQDLYKLLARKTGISEPKCLYIGDNLVQDIYTPSKLKLCDTLAVVEEVSAESLEQGRHPYEATISSRRWGSYFRSGAAGVHTVWGGIIRNHAKVCVPNLKVLASKPLDMELTQFERKSFKDHSGYYPTCPNSLRCIR